MTTTATRVTQARPGVTITSRHRPHAGRDLSAYVARLSRRTCLLAVSRPWEPDPIHSPRADASAL